MGTNADIARWVALWHNGRDLGDLGLGAGRRLAPGVLARSEGPEFGPRDHAAVAARAGYRTRIDLRSPREVAPHTVGPDTVLRPLFDEHDDSFWATWAPRRFDAAYGPELLGVFYSETLDRWPDRCRAALATVATAQPGLIVSCRLGQDRTGLLVAVILKVLGAPDEVIVSDYAVSEANVDRLLAAAADTASPGQDRAARRLERRLNAAPRTAIETFLASAALARFLDRGPLPDEDLRTLEARLCASVGMDAAVVGA